MFRSYSMFSIVRWSKVLVPLLKPLDLEHWNVVSHFGKEERELTATVAGVKVVVAFWKAACTLRFSWSFDILVNATPTTVEVFLMQLLLHFTCQESWHEGELRIVEETCKFSFKLHPWSNCEQKIGRCTTPNPMKYEKEASTFSKWYGEYSRCVWLCVDQNKYLCAILFLQGLKSSPFTNI